MENYYFDEHGQFTFSTPAYEGTVCAPSAIRVSPPEFDPESSWPILNKNKDGWDIVPISNIKRFWFHYEEASRPFSFKIEHAREHLVFPYSDGDPKYLTLFRTLENPGTYDIALSQWIRNGVYYANSLLDQIYDNHELLRSDIINEAVNGIYQYSIFSFVGIIRTNIDLIICALAIRDYRDEIMKFQEVYPGSIYDVLDDPKGRKAASELKAKIANDEPMQEFLRAVNDVANAYKHCVLNSDRVHIFGFDFPTVVAYQMKYHKFEKMTVRVYNYDLRQFVVGMNEFLMRTLVSA